MFKLARLLFDLALGKIMNFPLALFDALDFFPCNIVWF
jgi:hypothetical protein